MLPIEVREAIVLFAEWNYQYAVPAEATGECSDASWRFTMFTSTLRIPADEWIASRPVHKDRTNPFKHHSFVHCDGYAIDFTARQFWTRAPYPLVEPIQDYGMRFVSIGPDEADLTAWHLRNCRGLVCVRSLPSFWWRDALSAHSRLVMTGH